MKAQFQFVRVFAVVFAAMLFVFTGQASAQTYVGGTAVSADTCWQAKGTSFSGGNGSADAPYVINDCDQLQKMNENLGANYVLGKDIDCSATKGSAPSCSGFTPIGTFFRGKIDGKNFRIKNMVIRKPGDGGERGTAVGFIEYLGEEGRVENIKFENVDFLGNYCVGGIACNSSGTISNVIVTGNLYDTATTYQPLIGGLVANNQSVATIENSGTDVQVTKRKGVPDAVVGGLVGKNEGVIRHSFAKGTVTGEGKVGGFCGLNNRQISNSYSLAHVVIDGNSAQSLVGVFIGQNTTYYPYWVAFSYGADVLRDPLAAIKSFANAPADQPLNEFPANTVCLQRDTSDTACKTAAQMRVQATYSDWDFVNAWEIEGSNFPRLQWEPLPYRVTVVDKGPDSNVVMGENLVAWQKGADATSYNMLWFNVATGKTSMLPDIRGGRLLAMSGTRIVWNDTLNRNLMTIDVVTGQRRVIQSNVGANISGAVISVDYFVYNDNGFLQARSLRDGHPVFLKAPFSGPVDILGNKAVYSLSGMGGRYDVIITDLDTGSKQTVAQRRSAGEIIFVDSNRLAWLDFNQIILYDLSTRQMMPVLVDTKGMKAWLKAVSGKLVWSEGGKIYVYDLNSRTTDLAARHSVTRQELAVFNGRVAYIVADAAGGVAFSDLKLDREMVTLTVAASGEGSGHITSIPVAFNCSKTKTGEPVGECVASFDKGTNVVLYWPPDEGSLIKTVDTSRLNGLVFAKKTIAGVAPNAPPETYVLPMNAEAALGVEYSLKMRHTLIVRVQGPYGMGTGSGVEVVKNGIGSGSVLIGQENQWTVDPGTSITLAARSVGGVVLNSWVALPGQCGSSGCALTMNSPMTVVAKYSVDPQEVRNAYLVFLGRLPEAREMTNWVDQSMTQGRNLMQIRQEVAASPEVNARKMIVAFYKELLGRAPSGDGIGQALDTGELKAAMDQFRAGMTLDAIRNGILNSAEYLAKIAPIDFRGEARGTAKYAFYNFAAGNQRVELRSAVNNALIAQGMTTAQGVYSFKDLKPGNYSVVIMKQAIVGYTWVRSGWMWRLQAVLGLKVAGSRGVPIPKNGGLVIGDLLVW